MVKNKLGFILLMLFMTITILAEEAPVVKVVYNFSYAPFSWEENGVAKGLEVEIAEYCLSKLGIKAESRCYPWARAQEMIKSGEADLMITTPTDQRFQYGIFAKEDAVRLECSLFSSKENIELVEKIKEFTKFEELKPYSFVDYIGNGWTTTYMKKEDGYKIETLKNSEQIVKMIAANRAAFTISESTIIHWTIQNTNTEKEIVETKLKLPNTKLHFVFILSRNSKWVEKGLIKGLDKEIVEMKKSGKLEKILLKYGNNKTSDKTFKSQIQTQQFYNDYEKYPSFSLK